MDSSPDTIKQKAYETNQLQMKDAKINPDLVRDILQKYEFKQQEVNRQITSLNLSTLVTTILKKYDEDKINMHEQAEAVKPNLIASILQQYHAEQAQIQKQPDNLEKLIPTIIEKYRGQDEETKQELNAQLTSHNLSKLIPTILQKYADKQNLRST